MILSITDVILIVIIAQANPSSAVESIEHTIIVLHETK